MKFYSVILISIFLFSCVSAIRDHDKCSGVIVSEPDTKIIFHGRVDDRLVKGLKQLYENVYASSHEKCHKGVEEIIKQTALRPNESLIYIGVDDFYKFNYNYVSSHLIYAGDIAEPAFKVTYDKCENNSLNCKTKSRTYKKVALMTKNVADNPTLYKFIIKYLHKRGPIIMDKISKIPNVLLVCDPEENIGTQLKHEISKDLITIELSYDCETDVSKYQGRLLAVLSPKPFKVDNNVKVPVLLYKPPCHDENISSAKNYVNIMNSCDIYKDSLMKLIKDVGWERVAIISDNTVYSMNTERDIIALFEENGIVYTAVRGIEGVNGGCKFTQALETLKAADARVVVVNVDEDNLKELLREKKEVWNEANKKTSWIFKDYMNEYKSNMDVFTIYLAPQSSDESIYRNLSINTISGDFPKKSRIIEGIIRIGNAYKLVKDQYDNQRQGDFLTWGNVFRLLTSELKIRSKMARVTSYIFFRGELFNERSRGGRGYNLDKFTPDMDKCNLKSSNFTFPCDDMNVLKILFVLVVVAAIALIMTVIHNYYFTSSTSRYRNLR